MLLRASIAALSFASWALAGAPDARADEAYVCDQNRVVYVKPGELETLKHTDPCIAAYYGLKIDDPAGAKPAAQSTDPSSTAPVDLKKLDAPEDHAHAGQKNARFAQNTQAGSRPRVPPVASPGTDFRNVRLLNAGSDSDGWYRHTQ
jgi:hypothetical protein